MKFIPLLLTLITFNLSAASNKNCYPFQPNQEGFNKVCVTLENAAVLNTPATIEVYQNQKLVNTVAAKRFYTPDFVSCAGKEHQCRDVKSQLVITTPSLKENVIEFRIALWEQAQNKCKSGLMTINNRPHQFLELYMECSRAWWENI